METLSWYGPRVRDPGRMFGKVLDLIAAYFLRNPEAADSIEGMARWERSGLTQSEFGRGFGVGPYAIAKAVS